MDPRDNALISTFGRLLEVQSRLERRLGADLEARCNLPHAWFEVLLRLGRSEDDRLTMGSLAEQVSLTSGGVTRLVDRLQAAGYVERLPCPSDRRVSYAALTPAGRAELDKAVPVVTANLRTVFADFGVDDRSRLDDLLDRLREGAHREPAALGAPEPHQHLEPGVRQVAAGFELGTEAPFEPALHLDEPAEGGDERVVTGRDRQHANNLAHQQLTAQALRPSVVFAVII